MESSPDTKWQTSKLEHGVMFWLRGADNPSAGEVEVRQVPEDKEFARRGYTLSAERALQGLPRDLASDFRNKRQQYPANQRILERTWNVRLLLSLATTAPGFQQAIAATKLRVGLARAERELCAHSGDDFERRFDLLQEWAFDDPAVRVAAEALTVDLGLLNMDFVLKSILRGEPVALQSVSWGGIIAEAFQSSKYDWDREIGRKVVAWEALNARREWERTSERFLAEAARSLVKLVIVPPPPPPLTAARTAWQAARLSSATIHVGAANTEIDLRAVWPDVMNLRKRLPTVESSDDTNITDEVLNPVYLPDQPRQPAYFAFDLNRDMTFASASVLFRQAVRRRHELRGGHLPKLRSPKDWEIVATAAQEQAPDFNALAKGSAYRNAETLRKAVLRAMSRFEMDGVDGATGD
ncbi:MAG: hypothetical protein IT301_01530 [Dehalococcoidia bacterium]|nr:hypothetical protein [Dehalococcoidia bacterium]